MFSGKLFQSLNTYHLNLTTSNYHQAHDAQDSSCWLEMVHHIMLQGLFVAAPSQTFKIRPFCKKLSDN